MEIKAYRVQFTGKDSFGVPLGDPIPIEPVKEEQDAYETDGGIIYTSVTHDRRGSNHQNKGYYQVVFRIVKDDNEKTPVKLVLDRDHGNPLVHDDKGDSDLWYQKTWFLKNERPSNEGPYVDSIKTAGTFNVSLINEENKEEISRIKVIIRPSLIDIPDYQFMLDRLLTIHGKLVVLSESAVGIGSRDISGEYMTPGSPEHDVSLWRKLKPEIQAIIKMPATLQQKKYQRMPLYKLKRFDNRVLQAYFASGGQWAKGIIYTDDYDTQENRVIKYIIQKISMTVFPACKERILSDEEIERNIQEDLSNQFSSKAVSWYRNARTIITSVYESSANGTHFAFQTGIYQSGQYQVKYASGSSRKPRLYFTSNNGNYEIRTFPVFIKGQFGFDYFDPFESKKDIPGFSLYPFTYDGNPCGVSLHTKNISVAYAILLSLAKVFDRIESEELTGQQISVCFIGCMTSTTKDDQLHFRFRNGDKTVSIIKITDVVKCNMEGVDSLNDSSITTLYSFYAHIMSTSILKYMETPREMELVESAETNRNSYKKWNKKAIVINDGVAARKEIESILSNPWFSAIVSVPNVRLQKTPLFLYDKHYRAIYNILHEIISQHPLLTSNLDENLYGVHETTLIYEYWVFYELMNRFMNLGFTIDGDVYQNRDTIIGLFVNYLLKNMKPEGFAVCLHKDIDILDNSGSPSGRTSPIEVMIGFNCIFGDQEAPKRKQYDIYLTPDYFIRVTRSDGYHWYFLDAKYEKYTEDMLYLRAQRDQRKNSIADVCFDKYIGKMQEKRFIDQFAEYHSGVYPQYWKSDMIHNHSIEGAYLIIARYSNEMKDQITIKDRLCGRDAHGITEDSPMHRFGSIVFRPGLEDELTTLLEMIFEYKEGGQLIVTGEAVKKKTKKNGVEKEIWDIFNNGSQVTHLHVGRLLSERPITLNTCWDSSNEHTLSQVGKTTITPQLTSGGRYKYHIACSCGARRYENYCIGKKCRHEIIKHDRGNYHSRYLSSSSWDRWNYICPYCGSVIDSEESDDNDYENVQNDDENGTYTEMYNQSIYEAPPPSDDELAQMVPPDEYDNHFYFG